VAGCLAGVDQEQDVRDIISKVGNLHTTGTTGEVLRTVEAVWQRRDILDGETWDLATCLRILGRPLLLI
jgi:hypothetical protein